MRELKIGDRVVVLKKQLDTIPAGAVGTVVSFDNPVLVDFGRNGEECIIRTDEPYKVRCGLCTHFGISLHDIGFLEDMTPKKKVVKARKIIVKRRREL